MYLFLITFLALYGSMHLYAFYKLRDALRFRPHLTSLLISWMIFMTITPLLVQATEQFEMEKAALFIAWPGYLWMGFLFIFTSIMLSTDTLRYAYRIVSNKFYKQLPQYLSSQNVSFMALILAVIASIYAYVEAGQIRCEHLIIASSKLPPSVPKIRIVQISDMHIGLLSLESRQEQILETIQEAKPDILVSTGDLIDGKLNRENSISDHSPLAALLASVPTPLGKFAVIGNHEVYAGLSQAISFSHAAGFTLLRNKSVQPMKGLTISGVDDYAVNSKTHVDCNTEEALFNLVSNSSFNLLLKHRPDIVPESDGRFNLQLSGHVHGGQIFPFNFLVRLKYPIPCGTTTTPSGSYIHVSRGTGTWGPPMRLFAPPEITIIDVVSQQ